MPSSAPLSVAIVGSGLWGTAFGHAIAGDSCRILFYDKVSAQAQAAADSEYKTAVADLSAAVTDADLIIVAVSTAGFSDILARLAAAQAPVIWLTKGFTGDGLPLYEAAAQLLGADGRYGVISGPSFADEAKRGLPMALSLAMTRAEDGDWIRRRLHRPHLRLYRHDDIIGVCIGGALKNIIAIAAGISDGLALGYNARAALITRGLAEINALNTALGGQPDTMLGLCGIGDLILTCCCDLSRNRRLGLALASETSEDNTASTMTARETCEGATAAAAAAVLAEAHGLELPIVGAVAAVLSGDLTPAAAVQALLARPPRD